MHEIPILRDLFILVLVAIPVVAATHRLRIPTVVGYLLAGLVIGPDGLGLIGRTESVAGLAEVGVVLLLFTVGLELSLSRIVRLGRLVLQGGSMQVVATMAAVAAITLAGGAAANRAVFYGALAALSSTAIVLKVYTDRGELDTPHGRAVVAILLFQDLCVVPLMLLVPLLAGTAGGTGSALGKIALSLGVVGGLVAVGRILVPRVLERVAGLQNREIFTLCIVFLGLGSAYVTASFGLALALGTFIAGLVISESEYGVQAMSDILPFRDTFSGIFFISVGMLLDLDYVLAHPLLTLAATVALILVKSSVATVVVGLLHRSLQVSMLSALALAQIGEFSFVLAQVGSAAGLLEPQAYQLFLGASVLSMLATPFIIAGADPVARRLAGLFGQRAIDIHPHEEERVAELKDHVIIVGYGLNGRNLARVLSASGIRYVILEQNGQTVRRARLEREPIFFGDGASSEVLERVGIRRARVIVYAISAATDERRGVASARHLNPEVHIVVRTRRVAEIEELQRLGAEEVVPEEFETSLEIFARVLRLYGVPWNSIQREVDAARGGQYGILRRVSAPGVKLDALKHLGINAQIETVEVEEDAQAVSQNPATMQLRKETGATVVAVVRKDETMHTPDPDFIFQVGDLVVLIGEAEALRKAIPLFRRSGRGSRLSMAYLTPIVDSSPG